jgi:hypothetical protein
MTRRMAAVSGFAAATLAIAASVALLGPSQTQAQSPTRTPTRTVSPTPTPRTTASATAVPTAAPTAVPTLAPAPTPEPVPEGKTITRDTWKDHIPVVIGVVLFVLAVDALVVWKIIRDRKGRATQGGTAMGSADPHGLPPHL